jgi:hypothetical protein
MIDGKSFTYWQTAYTPSAPSHPHEVQIALGIEYTVNSNWFGPTETEFFFRDGRRRLGR